MIEVVARWRTAYSHWLRGAIGQDRVGSTTTIEDVSSGTCAIAHTGATAGLASPFYFLPSDHGITLLDPRDIPAGVHVDVQAAIQAFHPFLAQRDGLFPMSLENLHLQTGFKRVEEGELVGEESVKDAAERPNVLTQRRAARWWPEEFRWGVRH